MGQYSYFWKMLSDFWDKFADKGKIEGVWDVTRPNKMPLPIGNREGIHNGPIGFARFTFGRAAKTTCSGTGCCYKLHEIQSRLYILIHDDVDHIVYFFDSCARIWWVLDIDG